MPKPAVPYALVPQTGGEEQAHALVRLDPEYVGRWLMYMETVETLKRADQSVREIVLDDDAPMWFFNGDVGNWGTNDAACERLDALVEETVNESEPRLLHPDLFSRNPSGAYMHETRLSIEDSSACWKVIPDFGGAEFTTADVTIRDFYAALAWALPDDRLPGLLERAAREDPRIALDMIESGVAIEGVHGKIRRPLTAPEHVIRECLTHTDREIRERAVRLLGRTTFRGTPR